jgi:hypothetical protein
MSGGLTNHRKNFAGFGDDSDESENLTDPSQVCGKSSRGLRVGTSGCAMNEILN